MSGIQTPAIQRDPNTFAQALGWVNVRDFGAFGDGVHDDTAAIQAAIDAVYNSGGGTVYVSRGAYLVNGPLQTANGYNARITLPYLAIGAYGSQIQPVSINIMGEAPPIIALAEHSNQAPPTHPVTFLTTATGSGITPSILGAPFGSTNGTAIQIRVSNIAFREHTTASHIACDFRGAATSIVEYVCADLDVPTGTPSNPTSYDASGAFWLTSSAASGAFTNYGGNAIRFAYAVARGCAFMFASHAVIDQAFAQNCFATLMPTDAAHSSAVGYVLSQACTRDIDASLLANNTPPMTVANLDLENPTAGIYDPNNYLWGEFHINVPLTQNLPPFTGCGNCIMLNLQAKNPISSSSLPANPLVSGTVYQNLLGRYITIYQPAYATTSGTAGIVAAAVGVSSSPSTMYTKQIGGGTSSTEPDVCTLSVPPGWYYSFTATGATIADAQILGE